MRTAAAALAAALLAAATAATASGVVTSGTIRVNHAAAGIRLGMKKADVVDKLGPPVFQNANGFLQYGPDPPPPLFDLYLGRRNRVRQLGISGRHFCLPGGPCMFRRHGLKQLRDRFGDRLKKVELETGETVYVLRGRIDGRRSFTSFSTPSARSRAKIIMVFLGFCPPRPTVCGA
jgi:hypothetical protein